MDKEINDLIRIHIKIKFNFSSYAFCWMQEGMTRKSTSELLSYRILYLRINLPGRLDTNSAYITHGAILGELLRHLQLLLR